jgi:hypothetical protein
MKFKITVERARRVVEQLQTRLDKFKGQAHVSAVVGYGTDYAVYVHEDLAMNHPNGGQAKFLEEPARVLAPKLGTIISQGLQQGKTLRQVLLSAAVKLKIESQALVPVDTGLLKSSAFARLD